MIDENQPDALKVNLTQLQKLEIGLWLQLRIIASELLETQVND